MEVDDLNTKRKHRTVRSQAYIVRTIFNIEKFNRILMNYLTETHKTKPYTYYKRYLWLKSKKIKNRLVN